MGPKAVVLDEISDAAVATLLQRVLGRLSNAGDELEI